MALIENSAFSKTLEKGKIVKTSIDYLVGHVLPIQGTFDHVTKVIIDSFFFQVIVVTVGHATLQKWAKR